MNNLFKTIEKWSKEKETNNKEYFWEEDATNIIGQLLKADGWGFDESKRFDLMQHIKAFRAVAIVDLKLEPRERHKEDVVNAYCNIIIDAIEALIKVGVDPDAINKKLKEIENKKDK